MLALIRLWGLELIDRGDQLLDLGAVFLQNVSVGTDCSGDGNNRLLHVNEGTNSHDPEDHPRVNVLRSILGQILLELAKCGEEYRGRGKRVGHTLILHEQRRGFCPGAGPPWPGRPRSPEPPAGASYERDSVGAPPPTLAPRLGFLSGLCPQAPGSVIGFPSERPGRSIVPAPRDSVTPKFVSEHTPATGPTR